jgi:SpoVK/Ycf46/Vps4 family AAA+-type ATPase
LLREVIQENFRYNRTLVLIGPAIELPPEISVQAAEFVLPTISAAQIRQVLNEEAALWRNESGNAPQASQNALDLMVRYLTGTSREFAQRIIRHAIRDDGKITRDDLKVILEQKRIALGDSLIDFCFSEQHVDDIGGLNNLKSWVALRQKPFLQPDPDSGIDIPKGVLLLGVQGCGKSLAAKAVAGSWGVPLLRLDFGSLYNKFFGESERNLRKALQAAEEMSPCVLWVDEIEKGLASDSGGSTDGGVSRRILGTLLTWLSERKTQVFLIATANDISALPPELMRKGRFDELFFVDLPDIKCRADIFNLHLRQRKQDAAAFDLNRLAELAHGFSGAEIEACIRQSLLESYAHNRNCQQADLEQAVRACKPLSVLRAEDIASLRNWAADRTIFA